MGDDRLPSPPMPPTADDVGASGSAATVGAVDYVHDELDPCELDVGEGEHHAIGNVDARDLD